MTELPGISADVLAQRPLTLAALEGEKLVGSGQFPPGAEVSVGSNSGNALVLPARFELTAYTLLSRGCVLHLAPPLYVDAKVWVGDQVRELRGHFRDLRRAQPDLPDALPLAGERFLVRYHALALLGRLAASGVDE